LSLRPPSIIFFWAVLSWSSILKTAKALSLTVPRDQADALPSVEIVGSVVLDRPFRDAPVSPLYYEGKKGTARVLCGTTLSVATFPSPTSRWRCVRPALTGQVLI
jgi:hypothetical protein